ncbi:hypothetical protein GYMLUDRAFT_63929 [Collybiopsis luxurians FD-317 M1]|uniref:Uncharacterized protein n=1 Tax=Collybiopsis luxurians FD-317 M1 TaxID=944289 RepID=A0A0D0CD90_9AGAR|nr:hypothetical protein GYMLUDRAFT_63929 [Collybiopsis luxurians FD-317 M1]
MSCVSPAETLVGQFAFPGHAKNSLEAYWTSSAMNCVSQTEPFVPQFVCPEHAKDSLEAYRRSLAMSSVSLAKPLISQFAFPEHADLIEAYWRGLATSSRSLTEPLISQFVFPEHAKDSLEVCQRDLAMSSISLAEPLVSQFAFPEHAKDFEPGTHLDLHAGWYWTMDQDLENSLEIPVRFSALPSPVDINQRAYDALNLKLNTFHFCGPATVEWVYWFFEPPWTVKIGRTNNLARQMYKWN